MSHLSPDGRFELHHFSSDDDSYFYSYTDHDWYVTSVETGDELHNFSGSDNQDRSGRSQKGTKHVFFTTDSRLVVEELYAGGDTRHRLPVKIATVDGGKKIRLEFDDGTIEERPRKRLIHATKFGEPSVSPLKDDPDEKRKSQKN